MKQTNQKKVAVFCFGSVMFGKHFHISYESTPRKKEKYLSFSVFIPEDGECTVSHVGRNSSVGISIRYGLDGPGIESRWGAKFSTPVQTGSEAHPASYKMSTESYPEGKAAGAWL